MGSQELSHEERFKRFLYTCSYHGAYITGGSEKHICKFASLVLLHWIKSSPEDFIKALACASEDPLLSRRISLFYVTAQSLHGENIPTDIKLTIKHTVFKLIKTDEEFFDFIKFYTLLGPKRKQKITTSLKKMIVKFYQDKQPQEFAECVTKQESYHGWSHKDLIKLCHYKTDNILCEPILKYVLFGLKQLPENTDNESKPIVEYLRKSHELRITEDVTRAVALMKELHATVDQVNSKLNKNEEVWMAAIPHMNTREVLQCLYRFYRFGFLKPGSQFQAKVIEALINVESVKKCNLHPVEVYIYLKFFERGGKTMDPKLLEYLQSKEIKEETLKKLTTPSEPKCKPIIQNINKCLKLSYDNVQPTGKKYMVTIDITEKAEETCFHNKRITFLEAAVTIIRFLTKVEKNVTIAVFKDSQINFVDISKSHSAIEKLQEHKAAYIIPSAPIEWARNKKKQIDVFINFMSCSWLSGVPSEVKEKMERIPEALNKYSKKMKMTDVRMVKMFLGGPSASYAENSRNILAIAGFSVEVPRVLEAFCRGQFC